MVILWEFLCPGFCSFELTPAIQTRCRGTRILLSMCASIFKPAHHLILWRIVTPSEKSRHSPICLKEGIAAVTFVLLLQCRRQAFR